MRELIIFNANGVLKHQAVMLGRAEAPKKKKVGSIIFSFMAEQKSYSYSGKCVRKYAAIELGCGFKCFGDMTPNLTLTSCRTGLWLL